MRNKKLLFIATLLLLALVIGVLYTKSKDDKKVDLNSNSSETESIFTSVKDVLSRNLSLVCEFSDETGVSTKSYIKNGAVRIISTGESVQMSEIIMKDKKMYMWDLKTKEGFVYDIPDSDTDTDNKSEPYLSMIDEYLDFCKISTVEDSYFTPPADIVFQDMSKLLENLKDQMPQVSPTN